MPTRFSFALLLLATSALPAKGIGAEPAIWQKFIDGHERTKTQCTTFPMPHPNRTVASMCGPTAEGVKTFFDKVCHTKPVSDKVQPHTYYHKTPRGAQSLRAPPRAAPPS